MFKDCIRDNGCAICGSHNDLINFKSVYFCEKCVLKKLYDFKKTTKSFVCNKYKDKVLL